MAAEAATRRAGIAAAVHAGASARCCSATMHASPLLAALVAARAARAGAAERPRFASALAGLGDAAGRERDPREPRALGALNDPRSLPALEALVDGRLRDRRRRAAYFYDRERLGRVRDAADRRAGAPDAGDAHATVAINNRVRRAASRAAGAAPASSRRTRPCASPPPRSSPQPAERRDGRPAAARRSPRETDAGVRDALELGARAASISAAATRRSRARGARAHRRARRPRAPRRARGAARARTRTAPSRSRTPRCARRRSASIGAIDRKAFFVDVAAQLLLRPQPGERAAARRARPRDHLRPDGRHQHGPRRDADARRLHHLRRADLFQRHAPAALDCYLLAAIPAAFVVCALVGMLLERSVIRFLYGRPLETLLATWGISLILIQTVRTDLRRAERRGREPELALGRLRDRCAASCCPGAASAIVLLRGAMVAAVVLVLLQRTRARPAGARGDAEPRDGGLPGHRDRARRHA